MNSSNGPSSGPVGERSARRRDQRGASGKSRAIVAAAAVATLVAVGGTGWAMTRGSGESPPTSAATVASAAPTTSSTSSSTSVPSPAATPSPPPSGTADVSGAFTACRNEVSRGDALAAVAGSLAAHWRIHTSAQALVDAGKIPVAQAKSDWARTKKAGPTDVKNFVATSTAYDKVKGSCSGMSQMPPSVVAAARKCTQHASANNKVASTIGPVAAAWEGHLSDMKTKSETPVGAYMTKWRGAVEKTPQAMKKYEDAASAVRSSPRCPSHKF